MSDVLHLVREWHDVVLRPTEIWCEAEWHRNVTGNVEEATCEACLRELKRMGHHAEARLIKLISRGEAK